MATQEAAKTFGSFGQCVSGVMPTTWTTGGGMPAMSGIMMPPSSISIQIDDDSPSIIETPKPDDEDDDFELRGAL